jgi:hypothetical protein
MMEKSIIKNYIGILLYTQGCYKMDRVKKKKDGLQ